MPWSAEEMLDAQRQRVNILAYARTTHDGLPQKRLKKDLSWIVLHVSWHPIIKGLNWTEPIPHPQPPTPIPSTSIPEKTPAHHRKQGPRRWWPSSSCPCWRSTCGCLVAPPSSWPSSTPCHRGSAVSSSPPRSRLPSRPHPLRPLSQVQNMWVNSENPVLAVEVWYPCGDTEACSQYPAHLWNSFTFYFLQPYCPNGIYPMGNSGCFHGEEPAVTGSRYLNYSAC